MEKPWHAKTDQLQLAAPRLPQDADQNESWMFRKCPETHLVGPGFDSSGEKVSQVVELGQALDVMLFQLTEHAAIDTGQLDASMPGARDRFLLGTNPSRGVEASQGRHEFRDKVERQ
jgi:hypothetical protein